MRQEISTMRGRNKTRKQIILDQYEKQVVEEDDGKNLKMKYKDAWDAALQVGCERVKIDDQSYAQFACVLNQCEHCESKWKGVVPDFEKNCNSNIDYIVWGTHYKCTFHLDLYMGVKDGA